MSHPRALLPLIAEGLRPPEDVRAHLASCESCADAVEALSPLDLGYVWDGVASEADAPRPGVLERALVRCGVGDGTARFVAATPSLRPEWLLASAGTLALAALGMAARPGNGLSLVVLLAPVVAAALVAFAYGPASDDAYELVAATPLSPLLALLLRLAVVLSANSVLVLAADVVAGGPGLRPSWFLPMTFVALVAAGVGVRTSPLLGAGAGIALWSAAVFTTVSLSEEPERLLWGAVAQVLYAVGSVAVLAALCALVVRSGGFVTGANERRTA
ncbi:MAG TPA: hypothetical protein VHN37_16150 [Actinomycetota bacterium]|nr:hypothetical protein [Actinomycetota bacterium]